MTTAIGRDIGGTGRKGGGVDLDGADLLAERGYGPTPQPPGPETRAAAAAEVVASLDHPGPVGVGFPAVIEDGFVWTASNIDRAWVGQNVVGLLQDATGREVRVANDADCAALCEARYGPARGVGGVVLVVTFG